MPRPRRGAAVWGAFVALAGALALWPASAQARDIVVVSVDPADATALSATPTEIVLTCTGPPDADASHVTVRDGTGKALTAGVEARAVGSTLHLPVTFTTNGDFTVVYHVVLANGDDAVGVARFSIGTGVAPSVPPRSVQDDELASATAHQHGGVDPLGGTLLLIDVLVVFGAGLLLISRPGPVRRLRPGPAPEV
ncbi:copper resistance CopC family protein [Dactylosporangium sp. NPDC051484]|uniref:copper resistance CopC family protein n=1 Tax=Dactylosporangium sp. NPDC051484 TaxID=3154942 RepID=UPI00344FFCD5